ncbi:MAG: FtsX-like permease family protein [Mobilitalea sp.]
MLYKNTLKKIKRSFGRYISILIIVMIGVGFYAGIQASAPDMLAVADEYYSDQQLMDYKIVSTMGLTKDDVSALTSLPGVSKVIPSYSLDILSNEKALRIMALEDTVNTVKLITGRMPSSEQECLADDRSYKVGDVIQITDDITDKLEFTEYTVVGTIESALFLSKDYGSTTIGDGKLSSYVFINKNSFLLDAYTEIYLQANVPSDAYAYSDKYEAISLSINDSLVNIKSDREAARYQEIYDTANQEITKNEDKFLKEKSEGEQALADAKIELDDNAKKLKDGKAELLENESELKENEEKQKDEFKDAKEQIADGWQKIDAALAQQGIQQSKLDTILSQLDTGIATLETQLSQIPADSTEYAQLQATLEQQVIARDGLIQLKESIQALTEQEAELNQGIETFESEITKAKNKIEKAKTELADNEAKLSDGYEEYNENLVKFNDEIAEAEGKLSDAKEKLSEIEHPTWYINDRDAVVGYTDLKNSIDVVSSVAVVFPFLFIAIVILMTSNSMARMIAEERGELGTLASLGYKDESIIGTYLFYVLSATTLGAVIGFFVGCIIIPPLIYSNFQFVLPELILQYDGTVFILILATALTLMTIVTLVACHRELRHYPSVLMRPIPPKNGQKILLERIGFIWKHLSFTWKVTFRNMFRYKKRALMTIVGVAGCSALLLVGFGIRDSMNGIAERQYEEIFEYDNMIVLKKETKQLDNEVESLLTNEDITNPLLLKQSAIKCEVNSNSIDAFLIVPENIETFEKHFHLFETENSTAVSIADGIVISQKISDKLKLNIGDNFTLKDSDNNLYTIPVAAITENYLSNYVYITSEQYHTIFNEEPLYNTIVSSYSGDETTMAKRLIDNDQIVNVILTSDIMQTALDNNKSLNGIITLLVVVASLLAIIVLYNLTSINISERTREIATLKVLGFRDDETNGYIYREAFILTLISIAFGLVLGIILHGFVIGAIERDAMVLMRKIHLISFILSAIMTIVFSSLMQIVTYYKLKTIDMIQALKSVE